jgi:hypothetical protein
VYTAAVSAKARNPKGASAFVERLTGAATLADRSAAGFF